MTLTLALLVAVAQAPTDAPMPAEAAAPAAVTAPAPVAAAAPVKDAPAAKEASPAVARWIDSAKFSGFARVGLGYTFPLQDETLIGGHGGFRVADFRMGVEFTPAEKLSVVTSLELSAEARDANDPLLGSRGVALKDAYLEYRVCKGALVRAGQFRPGYYAEMLQSDATLPFISRSILATGLMPPEGYGPQSGLAPDRQVGVQLASEKLGGEAVGFRYLLGVFNGNGANQLFNDNNLPAVYGRVEVLGHDMLTVGVNASYNVLAQGVRPNRLYTTQLGYGADVTLKLSSVEVLAGFLGRNSTFNFAGLSAESAMGAMGQVRWSHSSGFEAALRATWLEPSSAMKDDAVTEGAVMVAYRPDKKPFRVLAQYTMRMEEPKVAYPNDSVDVMLHATW